MYPTLVEQFFNFQNKISEKSEKLKKKVGWILEKEKLLKNFPEIKKNL